ADLELPEGRYVVSCVGASTEMFVIEPRWRECVAPSDAPSDSELRGSLVDATNRGALASVERALYPTYFAPGTDYPVYSGQMLKGVAPVDGGIHEVVTDQPPKQTVVMKRRPGRPALPPADCFAAGADDTTQTGAPALAATPSPARAHGDMDRLLEYASA